MDKILSDKMGHDMEALVWETAEGVLNRKPVIIVGDYGFGGLVTPNTFRKHYNNSFRGKINGVRDEYFSLERLEGEIKRAFCLTFQELQMMSNQTITFLNI